MLEQPVRARFDPSGQQVVDVTVRRGYQPDWIRARAGLPLRIVFRREDDDACSERVVFSTARLDRRLSAMGATTIDLPAQPPGEIRFTCGMGRYRGHIEFVPERRPSILARLGEWVTRMKVRLAHSGRLGGRVPVGAPRIDEPDAGGQDAIDDGSCGTAATIEGSAEVPSG